MAKNNVIYLDSLPELVRILGKDTGSMLGKLGLETLDDLLYYYPRKYVDRGDLTPLDEGGDGDYLTYVARLKDKQVRRVKNNTLTVIQLTFTDGDNDIVTAFFSKHENRANRTVRDIKVGETAVITGTVRHRWVPVRNRRIMRRELIHPEIQATEKPIDPSIDPEGAEKQTEEPLIFYPSIEGIHNLKIVEAVKTAIGPLQRDEVNDPLPDHVREEEGLLPLYDAFMQIHLPANRKQVEEAKHTLRFHEAFMMQMALAQRRMWADSFEATARPRLESSLVDALDAQLPFTLTQGQQQVAAEISDDLNKSLPMQRLLQGEVGSGKTVVALRSMLQVVDNSAQTVLLAPTEVLAGQHEASIKKLLGNLEPEVGVTLLTGSLPTAQRKKALLDAASGKAKIIIGTHALLSENVQFADLGLVVVDEQHRFGVEQRDVLRHKADTVPHYLVMTATPIPRSVAMTIFGDVDTSTLREVPAGRAGVETHVVHQDNTAWMIRLWSRVREEVARGGRVYIVCPRIGEDDEADSDKESLTSVTNVLELLKEQPQFSDVNIQVMHGRLSTEEKDRAMSEFSDGTAPILVSTTVVEVGVDVPEATAMVIVDAHMFGISQLHQLRGRIGRGTESGICFVVTPSRSYTAISRLKAFSDTTDGFKLAELDLRTRKEGDVLGRAQSGAMSSLKLLRVMEDIDVIDSARRAAWEVLLQNPDLSQYPSLERAVGRITDQHEYFDRA